MPIRPPIHAPPQGSGVQRAHIADLRRGSAASRGYDRDWQRVRLAHLKAEPLCRFCEAEGLIVAAEVVDHIRPVSTHPELRLDDVNLRSLCKSHHDALTAQQVGEGHVGAHRPLWGSKI